MKVAVFGASGGVGKHIVAVARERGHEVTAVVRASAAAAAAQQEGVRVVVDEAVDGPLDDALAGQGAVLSGLGLRRVSKNPFAKLTSASDTTSRAAVNIARAMKKHGVARVIAVSSAGVADSFPRMNAVMRFMVRRSNIGLAYADLALMEQVFAKSGLDWLCARPCTLTNGARTERVRVVDAFTLTARISRADVAWWMVSQLDHATTGERTPQIASAS